MIHMYAHRPFSSRDLLVVQDYVLLADAEGKPWFYTLNHDVSHVSCISLCLCACKPHMLTTSTAVCRAKRWLHEDEREDAGSHCTSDGGQGAES